MRLAIGVTLAFVVSQFAGWPLAHVAPVLATVLLTQAVPPSIREALSILGTALLSITAGFVTALFLLPYPAVMALVAAALVYRFYLYVLVSTPSLLALVSVLLGFLIVPVAVHLFPELGLIAAVGLLLDFAAAILVTWVAFLVVPLRVSQPAGAQDGLAYEEAVSVAVTLTVVVAPLMIGFLAFGWSDILVLVYAAIFATGLSSNAGFKLGWKSMTANLVFGGIGTLIAYEILVMVPNPAFMPVLVFTVCLIFADRIFGGGPTAAAWMSGFIGFLIVFGGALLASGVVIESKILHRVLQIVVAMAYVILAYRVIDLIKGLFTARRVRGDAGAGIAETGALAE